ncbi:MAG: class I SAM-dependent methyltransferase [Chloroflexi bacterium]|nr:class I SAM-dependent methyltransferase [Chloroflexota bacterium]
MLAPSTRALIAFFDALAPRWNAMQSADRYERLARQLAPHAALFRDARLGLDIGTGTGAFLPHLARLAPHAQVIALDLSPVMLRMARASNGRDIVRAWLQGDVHRLPLPGACADLITCHNSFAHFEDGPAALRELARALMPGGTLFILHDIAREQVNAIHASTDSPRVRRHVLPPVEFAAAQVASAGFEVFCADDTPDHYLIIARRP